MISVLSSNAILYGNEDSMQGRSDEIFCSCKKSFQKDKDGTTGINPDRVWIFNDQTYLLNDSDQWVPSGLKAPRDAHQYLQDLADRGVCPKGHRGVYHDFTFYKEGLWCCRGIMTNGEKCFFHIDNQYPKGIPNGGK